MFLHEIMTFYCSIYLGELHRRNDETLDFVPKYKTHHLTTPWALASHSLRQLWESAFIMTHCGSSTEQCKATHPVYVTRWPVGPLGTGVPLLPGLDPFYTNPLLTPIHLDRPFLSSLPVLALARSLVPLCLGCSHVCFFLSPSHEFEPHTMGTHTKKWLECSGSILCLLWTK